MVDVWKELEFVVFMNTKSLFSAVYMLQCLCDVRYNVCANDTHVSFDFVRSLNFIDYKKEIFAIDQMLNNAKRFVACSIR